MANPRESAQLANRDANPPLLNDPGITGAYLRRALALVLCVTSDAANSIYRFFQLPSNAIISSLLLWNDALSASTTLDIGVADVPSVNSGATISQALFASAVAATNANAAVEERYNALAITTAGDPLWKNLGLSADPFKVYDICVFPHVTVVAGGNIVLEAKFTL